MRCSLFLAAGMNYSARGRDRLTLAILFLVPLMTVVVNIHRQTSFALLHGPSLVSSREILYLSIPSTLQLLRFSRERRASLPRGLPSRFFSAPLSKFRAHCFRVPCDSVMFLCVFSKAGREGGASYETVNATIYHQA